MPQIPHRKTVIIRHFENNIPPVHARAVYIDVDGYRNRPEWPERNIESPLTLFIANAQGRTWRGIEETWWVGGADAPNLRAAYYSQSSGWNPRLYAQAYTKFANAAREGSAEWGMNIIQYRQALKTFIQLVVTASTVITALHRTRKSAFLWLSQNKDASPESVRKRRRYVGAKLVRAKRAADRRRLSNEIWVLDQVSSTLLAYRYGVAPLVSDISATAEILSQPYKGSIGLRKQATTSWNGKRPEWADDWWEGKESVVLRATVSVINPNLGLANRVGLLNPQTWLWDAMPWSFVVDWWLPVGTFLSNLTALVGFNLDDASVTRTRVATGHWNPFISPKVKVESGTYNVKYKVRSVGSLPIPRSVPYGTGLGIQRGQNALALIAQTLTKKVLK